MRAFLAVVPPADVLDDLLDHLRPRAEADRAARHRGGADWRWTRPEHLHLTLAFLPHLPEHREEELAERLDDWAARRAPVPMRLAGAGAFPDPGSARVLWVGVQGLEAREALGRWAARLRDLASHCGASPDGRRFTPHVTVARSGRPRSAGRWVQALDTLESHRFRVGEVVLMESLLGQGPGGTPRYHVRHRATLNRSSDPPAAAPADAR